VLRSTFKSEFKNKYGRDWKDSPQSGKFLKCREKWDSKLHETQKKLLEDGNTKQWDPTLLFHVLLYSSMCLLTTDRGTVQLISQYQIKTTSSIDFTTVLNIGDTIMLDLGYPFCSAVTCVQKKQFQIKQNVPQHYWGKQRTLYICRPERSEVKTISFIRNKCFAHCEKAHISLNDLNDIVKKIEKAYVALKVSPTTIAKMKAILNGKHICVYFCMPIQYKYLTM